MRLHEIYLAEADIETFKKLDIRNIKKEWNQWFPQNKGNFNASTFNEFWEQAGYAESAAKILDKYQTRKIIGPWPSAAPAPNTATLANPPANWFAIPGNFKEFVTEVINLAASTNPALFQDRVDRFMNSRSWWELTGLSREDIARIRGGGNRTRKTSSSSSLPPDTNTLITKINSSDGNILTLNRNEIALLDLLITRHTDELAQDANLSGVRGREVESALKAIQANASAKPPVTLNLTKVQKALISELVQNL